MNWLKELLFKDDIGSRELNLERNLRIGKPIGIRLLVEGESLNRLRPALSDELSRAMSDTVWDTIIYLRKILQTQKKYFETGIACGPEGLVVLNAWNVQVVLFENCVMNLNSAVAVVAYQRFQEHSARLQQECPEAFSDFIITSRIFEFDEDIEDIAKYVRYSFSENQNLLITKPDANDLDENVLIEDTTSDNNAILNFFFDQPSISDSAFNFVSEALDTELDVDPVEEHPDVVEQNNESSVEQNNEYSRTDVQDTSSDEEGSPIIVRRK